MVCAIEGVMEESDVTEDLSISYELDEHGVGCWWLAGATTWYVRQKAICEADPMLGVHALHTRARWSSGVRSTQMQQSDCTQAE